MLAGGPAAGVAVQLGQAGGEVAVQAAGLGRLAEVVLEHEGLDGQRGGALVLAVAHHGLAVRATACGRGPGARASEARPARDPARTSVEGVNLPLIPCKRGRDGAREGEMKRENQAEQVGRRQGMELDVDAWACLSCCWTPSHGQMGQQGQAGGARDMLGAGAGLHPAPATGSIPRTQAGTGAMGGHSRPGSGALQPVLPGRRGTRGAEELVGALQRGGTVDCSARGCMSKAAVCRSQCILVQGPSRLLAAL